MRLDPETFRSLVAEASLSPSVHNIQPTRWHLRPDGSVDVLEDPERRLPVGDPEGRDVGVSHGSAVEGFCLAASQHGLAVTVLQETGCVARLRVETGAAPDPLADFSRLRHSYRGPFQPDVEHRLARLARGDDGIVVEDPDSIARLATLYDQASLRWFRNRAYRAELLSWMRLSRRHPCWSVDGLNAEAMAMSTLEAAAAGVVLRPGVFETLDRVGLAGGLVAEAPIVQSACAIVLFHRPVSEVPFDTGRRFHRAWLAFTEAGLSACPMAVLADDPEARSSLQREYDLPDDRRLITAFRIGIAPEPAGPARPRLDVDRLIV